MFQRDLEIEMLAAPGRSATLRTARLPGPLHMSAALMRYGHLSLRERLAVVRGGLKMLTMRRREHRALEMMTVADLMTTLGQSENARRRVLVPALDCDAQRRTRGLLGGAAGRSFEARILFAAQGFRVRLFARRPLRPLLHRRARVYRTRGRSGRHALDRRGDRNRRATGRRCVFACAMGAGSAPRISSPLRRRIICCGCCPKARSPTRSLRVWPSLEPRR